MSPFRGEPLTLYIHYYSIYDLLYKRFLNLYVTFSQLQSSTKSHHLTIVCKQSCTNYNITCIFIFCQHDNIINLHCCNHMIFCSAFCFGFILLILSIAIWCKLYTSLQTYYSYSYRDKLHLWSSQYKVHLYAV